MVFKIEKKAQPTPQHSEYYNQKVDIAAKFNTVFEPEDEDKRLDALFLNPKYYNQPSLLSMSRVMVQRKEQLVMEVVYDFYDNENDIWVDKGIGTIGRTLIPSIEQNPTTGEVRSNPNGKFAFDLDFSPELVDEYLAKYPLSPKFEFRFYVGNTSTIRSVSPVEVKRKEFFQYATWDELFIGKEKRYTSSTMNKLSSLRKEVDFEEKQQFQPRKVPTVTEDNNTPPIDPLIKTKQDGVVLPLSEEVRKIDQVEINEYDTPTGTKVSTKKETNNTGKRVVTNDDEEEVTITTRNEKKSVIK